MLTKHTIHSNAAADKVMHAEILWRETILENIDKCGQSPSAETNPIV